MMRAIGIDDEIRPLNLLRIMLDGVEEVDYVASFSNPMDALEYLRHGQIDLAFVDIEMPEMNGIEFAVATESLEKPPLVVFITAYSKYGVDAWSTNAIDCIFKPYDKQRLLKAIDKAEKYLRLNRSTDYEVRCFPSFDLIIDHQPLIFHSKRSKELLAYLVHYQNRWVDIGMIVYDLFGDTNEKASKSHFRVILARLRNTLKEYGLEEILKTEYGKVRADIPTDRCDYYRYLRGRKSLFTGNYMQEYSWAETEAERLRKEQHLE